MARYYKVRLPTRVASQWAKDHPQLGGGGGSVANDEAGVTFRVSDLTDGRIPTESTVFDAVEQDEQVGLDATEARDMLAAMAAAERAAQPDRLPIVVAVVVALLAVIMASGLVQTLVGDAREHLIQERIKRPRAQYGWSARVGADRKALGLPEKPVLKIDYVPMRRPGLLPPIE